MRCPDCDAPLPIRVCRSAAGFYIGRRCDTCGPYGRISAAYYPTRVEAERALASGAYETRDYALENLKDSDPRDEGTRDGFGSPPSSPWG